MLLVVKLLLNKVLHGIVSSLVLVCFMSTTGGEAISCKGRKQSYEEALFFKTGNGLKKSVQKKRKQLHNFFYLDWSW